MAESLQPILQLATCGIRSSLPLRPRTNSLIVSQSGSGKSFLVTTLAANAGIPIWHENISNWIVLGSRNTNSTFTSLVRWIYENKRGVIFLDELDKITSPHEYSNAVRNEAMSLLDYRVPDGAVPDADSNDHDELDCHIDPSARKDLIKFDVQQKLQNNFLIVGAGAWQSCWMESGNSIGFRSEDPRIESIGRQSLLKSIAPEILQRFREVLFLEPMTRQDYLDVTLSQVELLPQTHRLRFADLAVNAIPTAIEHGLGMRMFEDAYTKLCMEVVRDSCGDDTVFRDMLVGR